MAYTTIKKPSDYFNTKLYTGDGANYPSTQSITGVGFQPDLIWLKSRNNAYPHFLYDAVRTNRYAIFTNDTQAENSGTVNQMTSFDSDGFKVANDGAGVATNGSGSTMTSWNWLASNTTAANTDGSISSTVSASTTSGFSIVTYSGTGSTGATVGHGLGVAPSMIIARRLDGVEDWGVYHKTLGASKYIILNTTGADQSDTSRWGGVEPTNSFFTVGNHASVNASGGTHIAYCFAEKKGYSKFSSYVGNGSADGTFIYTGFKPSFVMVKNYTNAGYNWIIQDNKRDTFNPLDRYIYPNTSGAEAESSTYNLDFYSNGFKPRNTRSETNDANNGYIYMAFAEQPLVGDNPATAR